MPLRVPVRHRGHFDRDQFHDEDEGCDEYGGVGGGDTPREDLADEDEEGENEHDCQQEPGPPDGVPEGLVVLSCVQCLRDGLCEPVSVQHVQGDDHEDSCLPKRKARR